MNRKKIITKTKTFIFHHTCTLKDDFSFFHLDIPFLWGKSVMNLIRLTIAVAIEEVNEAVTMVIDTLKQEDFHAAF